MKEALTYWFHAFCCTNISALLQNVECRQIKMDCKLVIHPISSGGGRVQVFESNLKSNTCYKCQSMQNNQFPLLLCTALYFMKDFQFDTLHQLF